jgi:hypothetical protein
MQPPNISIGEQSDDITKTLIELSGVPYLSIPSGGWLRAAYASKTQLKPPESIHSRIRHIIDNNEDNTTIVVNHDNLGIPDPDIGNDHKYLRVTVDYTVEQRGTFPLEWIRDLFDPPATTRRALERLSRNGEESARVAQATLMKEESIRPYICMADQLRIMMGGILPNASLNEIATAKTLYERQRLAMEGPYRSINSPIVGQAWDDLNATQKNHFISIQYTFIQNYAAKLRDSKDTSPATS